MDLEKRLSCFVAAIILGLAGGVFALIGSTMADFEAARLTRDLKAAQAVYAQFEGERFRALESSARLLAGLPKVKAVFATKDSSAIFDVLSELREGAGGDFLDAFDDADNPYVGKSRVAAAALVKQARQADGPRHGYFSDGDSLYQAAAFVVNAEDGSPIGTLVSGYRIGDDVLGRLQALTQSDYALVSTDGKIMSSTAGATAFLGPGNGTTQKALEGLAATPILRGKFVAAAADLLGSTGEKVARVISIRSLSEGVRAAGLLRLRLAFLVFAIGSFAVGMGFVIARSIARPIRGLVKRIGAVNAADPASVKQLADPTAEDFAADGDVQEVLTAVGAFVLAADLEKQRFEDALVERTRRLEARVEGLEADNEKLVDGNQRLLKLLRSAA